jgi:hypothetical protein
MADDYILGVQFQMALAALKRIVRKRAGFDHKQKWRWVEGSGLVPEETCDCPQCIARYALEQIAELEVERCHQ